MGSLSNLLSYGPLIFRQTVGPQRLARTPEVEEITENEAARQYGRAWESNLAILYAIVLEWVHRARAREKGGTLLDLCCGPGNVALAAARLLDLDAVTGIDLSATMIEIARASALREGLPPSRAGFTRGDAADLATLADGAFDITTFTNGAHHLASLEAVGRALSEMARVTRPDGLVLLADIVRLRTERVTRTYIDLFGRVLLDLDLGKFYEEFRNSMYAAWTYDELQSVVPRDDGRQWFHFAPRGLAPIQLVVGVPKGRALFLRGGFPWRDGECPVPRRMRADWSSVRLLLHPLLRRAK